MKTRLIYKTDEDKSGNQIFWIWETPDKKFIVKLYYYSTLGRWGDDLKKQGYEYQGHFYSKRHNIKYFKTFFEAQEYIEAWFKIHLIEWK